MKRKTIDAHFEVILERVKELTEKSRKTVWYEIHANVKKSPTIVLINENGNIGFINITYKESSPGIYAGKLTKNKYDKLLQIDMDLTEYKADRPSSTTSPGDVVKWVTGVS